MLSLGIRFGEGFDGSVLNNLMQSVPQSFDYDLLVIGSNPGGVACAMEASLAGKKTALIKCRKYSRAEEEGFDEDLNKMEEVLQDSNISPHESGSRISSAPVISVNKFSNGESRNKDKNRKVRQSRLDLNNEFFKRGEQCRKLIHNAIILGDLVENAHNSGWRLSTNKPSLNWHKMSEEIMDFVMKENWTLATELTQQNIEIIEGLPLFKDNNTVKVKLLDKTETEITSEVICLALSSEWVLPEDVEGASDYGITCDDFIRLNEPPGKTLVVGGLKESLEFAGFVAGGRLPVTVVSRSEILKSVDSEILEMIIGELKRKGVRLKENTNLVSIEKSSDNKLLATFQSVLTSQEAEEEFEEVSEEEFDTVLFAVGKKVFTEDLNLKQLGIELEPFSEKIIVDKNGQTSVPNIFAVGDVMAGCPEGMGISQSEGKLLSRRLYYDESEIMDYSFIPSVMYTPTEYACVGISEDTALSRLGTECVCVYYGHFKPLDFVIPPKAERCFAKIIVFLPRDLVIGLHILGPQASELVQGFTGALKAGLTMTNFRNTPGIPGTTAQEIFKLKEYRKNEKIDKEL